MQRIEDLQYKGLKFIQDDTLFCFGCDSVELANFVTGGAKDRAIDLGGGSGIISILLAAKRGIKTTSIEINAELSELNKKNTEINGLSHLIDVYNMPMQQIGNVFKRGEFSIVVTNPPYFPCGSGEMSGTAAAFRHEVSVTMRQVVDCAAYCLSTGGRFYIVYPITRMAELLSYCTAVKLEPKELVILQAESKPPHLFLLKCIKDAAVGLKVNCRQIKTYGME